MKSRVHVNGGGSLANNPFQNVEFGALPDKPTSPAETKNQPSPAKPKKRGKAHLRIEKSGRGGKIVTVIYGEGIEHLSGDERASLLRDLKNALGVGGTLGAGSTLELQGDERSRLADRLKAAGFA